MATSTSPTECGVCQEEFNGEERCPRTLSCSHHLCSNCIDRLIGKNSKMCPFCRKVFSADSSNDVMINHGLLESAKYISLLKGKPEASSPRRGSSYLKRIEGFKEDAFKGNSESMKYLLEMKEQAQKLINNVEEMKLNLEQDASDIKENILPVVINTIKTFEENAAGLEPVTQKLQDCVKEIKKREDDLTNAKKKLESVDSCQDIAAIVDETEETNVTVNDWAEKMSASLADEDDQLQSARKEVKVAARMKKEFSNILSFKPENEVVPPIIGFTKQQDLSKQITVKGLWEMSRPVKTMVEQGRLFTLEGRQVAKIVIENNEVHLYNQKFESVKNPDIYYLEHSEVLKMAVSPRSIFMDICAQGLTLGRVRILLNGDEPSDFLSVWLREQNGYIKSALDVSDKGYLSERLLIGEESVAIHNYSLKGESLYRQDVRGFVDLKPQRIPTVTLVYSSGRANMKPQRNVLAISTCQYTRRLHDGKFIGKVTEGLEGLCKAIEGFENTTEVTIGTCGVVLPTE